MRLGELCIEVLQQNDEHHSEVFHLFLSAQFFGFWFYFIVFDNMKSRKLQLLSVLKFYLHLVLTAVIVLIHSERHNCVCCESERVLSGSVYSA